MKTKSSGAAGMGLLVSGVFALHAAPPESQGKPPAQPPATFYRDVLPILERDCQVCHRKGGIAPMALETYAEARKYAEAIRNAAEKRSMPPWFAEKGVGKFSNDPSLNDGEIALLAAWAAAHAPAGKASDAPPQKKWAERWTIPEPDMIVTMSEGVKIPAEGEVDYTYEIEPTHFAEGRWVRSSEILPGMPANVHHAVVYVRPPESGWLRHAPLGKPFTAAMLNTEEDRREAMWTDSDLLLVYAPGSTPDDWPEGMATKVHHAVGYVRPPESGWLRHAPLGKPFTAAMLNTEEDRREAMWTDSDLLLVYAPGSTPDDWPEGMAKYVPAGSDLVFQMHYTTNGKAGTDATRMGLVFAKKPPEKRVLTLQLTNDHFVIPPGVPDYRVEARGTLPQEALLLSFFPHMHLRGKRFEYNIVHADRRIETLLRVNYHFHWQMSYRLAEPLPLAAGTELQAVAWYDNSRGNLHNPDPEAEMMVGFFDVAVGPGFDKKRFFERGAE